jgi:hypothetical protein
MKSAPALLVACALLAASGPAASQAPAPAQAPAAAQQPQQPPPAAGTSLNLKLDEAELRRPQIRFGPVDKDTDGLPSLGANARPIDQSSGSRSESRSSPYPKNTNPGY